eukprot:CCRYP_010656-RA/>CCRYP_010656-RA protein AED:0.03 eAED:0.03 QI:248/1/1/1/1/1/2/467/243
MQCHPQTANGSLPSKGCMKKTTLDESISDSHRSLRSIFRRASYPVHHRDCGVSDAINATHISSSVENRRPSESILSLFTRLGSSRRVEHGVKKEKEAAVQFGDVVIREYEITASHHPGGRSGVPIELGWRYNVLEPIHVDDFESHRSTTRSADFHSEKKLTPRERERILRQFGVTESEMRQAAKRAAILRGKRRRSLALRHHDKFHEKLESFFDHVKYALGCKKRCSLHAVDNSGLHPSFWNQ